MKLFSSRLASSAMSFAHLASVGARARAEDDDEKDKDKEARAESDDKKDDESQDRDDGDSKAARADDPDAEDDDEKDDKEEARAARAESDDDHEEDDGEEARAKSAVARARLREQARCAEIFNCRAAARNVQLAAYLAFNTRMPAKEAIGVLQGTPAAASPARDARAQRNPSLGGGSSAGTHDSKAAMMASWDRAFKKATAGNHH